MRAIWLVSVMCSLSLGACSKTPKDSTVPQEKVGTMRLMDPAFLQTDPASRRPCKADADCETGALCHPGHLVCFNSYPNPSMLNITFTGEPEKAKSTPCALVTVYFAFDSADLVAEATRWLDYDARCIKSRSPQKIIIEGHADSRGDRDYNAVLSRRRAESVKTYLESQGVTVPVQIRGLGETDPLAKGSTERDYAYNRRAAIEVSSAP